MQRVFVTGGTGLLGSWLVPALRKKSYKVITVGRSPQNDLVCDLTNSIQFETVEKWTSSDIILNLAALANVDECQNDIQRAYLANIKIPENIAKVARIYGVKVINISTDHVYDSGTPSSEDNLRLRNVYALSKYSGEVALSCCASVSLRTNFFGKSLIAKPSFTDWIKSAFENGEVVTLFDDIFFSPVHWTTLLEGIESVIENFQPGVYNFGSLTGMNKAEFALKVAETLGLSTPYYKITSGSARDRVLRPKGMIMDTGNFARTFNYTFKSLDNEIAKLKKEYL